MMFVWLLLVLSVKAGSSKFIFDDSNEGYLNSTARTGLFLEARAIDAETYGRNGLCVIGCTPYVDLRSSESGIRKYRKMVEDMAKNCDVLVHVGDTKAGRMPCNHDLMTYSVKIMRRTATRWGKLALFAPGDNELNDCHRLGSREGQPIPSDIYKAADARQFLIDDLKLSSHRRDLTNRFKVDVHDMSNRNVPGTDTPYSCDFDKYVELDNYAVATMEVVGSHYYLDDERHNKPPRNYPKQNEVDPLAGRLPLYLNANDCTLEWIRQSAEKASSHRKRALFLLFHATFYTDNGKRALGNNGIGEYYKTERLEKMTEKLGRKISKPYQPLFDTLTETALAHRDLMIYVIHADAHRFSTVRMNPLFDNEGADQIESHHNLMLQMVEGGSRALTMYTKFTVDDESFQPVTLKQEWSRSAYNEFPVGHSWDPY